MSHFRLCRSSVFAFFMYFKQNSHRYSLSSRSESPAIEESGASLCGDNRVRQMATRITKDPPSHSDQQPPAPTTVLVWVGRVVPRVDLPPAQLDTRHVLHLQQWQQRQMQTYKMCKQQRRRERKLQPVY